MIAYSCISVVDCAARAVPLQCDDCDYYCYQSGRDLDDDLYIEGLVEKLQCGL